MFRLIKVCPVTFKNWVHCFVSRRSFHLKKIPFIALTFLYRALPTSRRVQGDSCPNIALLCLLTDCYVYCIPTWLVPTDNSSSWRPPAKNVLDKKCPCPCVTLSSKNDVCFRHSCILEKRSTWSLTNMRWRTLKNNRDVWLKTVHMLVPSMCVSIEECMCLPRLNMAILALFMWCAV